MTVDTSVILHRQRNWILGLYYGLIATLFFSSLGLTTALSITTIIIWLLQAFPLALFASGLHRQQVRSCQWLSFVTLMYFVHGVLVAFTPGRLLAGMLEVGFCSLLFIGLIIYIRTARKVTNP